MFPSMNNSSGNFSQDNYDLDSVFNRSPEVYTKPVNFKEPVSPDLDTYGMGPSSSPSWMRNGQDSYSGKENQPSHDVFIIFLLFRCAYIWLTVLAAQQCNVLLLDGHTSKPGTGWKSGSQQVVWCLYYPPGMLQRTTVSDFIDICTFHFTHF